MTRRETNLLGIILYLLYGAVFIWVPFHAPHPPDEGEWGMIIAGTAFLLFASVRIGTWLYRQRTAGNLLLNLGGINRSNSWVVSRMVVAGILFPFFAWIVYLFVSDPPPHTFASLAPWLGMLAGWFAVYVLIATATFARTRVMDRGLFDLNEAVFWEQIQSYQWDEKGPQQETWKLTLQVLPRFTWRGRPGSFHVEMFVPMSHREALNDILNQRLATGDRRPAT